jgi:hypothetical protein
VLGVSIITRRSGIVDRNCRLLLSLATTLFRPLKQNLASDRGVGLMFMVDTAFEHLLTDLELSSEYTRRTARLVKSQHPSAIESRRHCLDEPYPDGLFAQ